MSHRYEMSGADVAVTVHGPGTILGEDEVSDFALVLGDPDALAYAVCGDGPALLALLDRARAAVLAATSTAAALPTIEVLTVRDPDSSNDVTVWVDGVRTTAFAHEDVDPGAGAPLSSWVESTLTAAATDGYSPAFRDAVIEARDAYNDHSYITNDFDCGHDLDELTLDSAGHLICPGCEPNAPSWWVEPLIGPGLTATGPFDDEVAASLYMDEHGLSEDAWKIVDRGV